MVLVEQDADVLDQGTALRESDVYLIVEPVMTDTPAPGEDRFTPNEHQTFASRFEVYYWVGRSVSLEKPAIGAIKAVELAQVLSGRTALHRELQGDESAFLCRCVTQVRVLRSPRAMLVRLLPRRSSRI